MFSTASATQEQQRWSNMVASWLQHLAIADGSPPCMGIHVHTFPWLASRFRVRHGWDVQWCNFPLPDVFPNAVEVWWGGFKLMEPFSQGHCGWNLLHNVDCCLGLRCLGFVSPWIESARLNLSSRLEAGDYFVLLTLGVIWSFGSQASKGFYVISASSFSISPAVLVFGVCGLSFRMIWKPPASFTCYLHF